MVEETPSDRRHALRSTQVARKWRQWKRAHGQARCGLRLLERCERRGEAAAAADTAVDKTVSYHWGMNDYLFRSPRLGHPRRKLWSRVRCSWSKTALLAMQYASARDTLQQRCDDSAPKQNGVVVPRLVACSWMPCAEFPYVAQLHPLMFSPTLFMLAVYSCWLLLPFKVVPRLHF